MTLVLTGFDLTFRVADDGQSIEIVSVDSPVEIVRSFNAPNNAAELVVKLADMLPDARIQVVGGKISVRGRLEDCEAVGRALKGESLRRTVREPAGTPGGKQVFTLTVENKPVGPVISAIAKQLDMEIKFDDEAINLAGLSTEAMITFQVKNVTLDELLTAALKPVGLNFRRDGSKIIIGPAEK